MSKQASAPPPGSDGPTSIAVLELGIHDKRRRADAPTIFGPRLRILNQARHSLIRLRLHLSLAYQVKT